METDVNYIPFFSEIEDTFIRLREGTMFLSPLDWALIESWKERGIPMHVVLSSLEEVFKNHKSKARRRGINSLRYCQSEVEAQFGEYCNAMVGKNTFGESDTASESDPFGREAIQKQISDWQDELHEARHAEGVSEVLATALDFAHRELLVVWRDFDKEPNARKLEDELTRIDREIEAAMEQGATDFQLADARDAAVALLEPYKSRMPPETYQQQFDILFKKHLREFFNVPKLSLFHMR